MILVIGDVVATTAFGVVGNGYKMTRVVWLDVPLGSLATGRACLGLIEDERKERS